MPFWSLNQQCKKHLTGSVPEWKYPYHSISNNTVHFNGHVSTWTWVSWYQNVSIPNFTRSKNDESGGDNWSYRMQKAPVKSSPSTNQHPTFYRPDALPVTQPTASEHFLKQYNQHFKSTDNT